jgi:hypothetical protein
MLASASTYAKASVDTSAGKQVDRRKTADNFAIANVGGILEVQRWEFKSSD